jgi:EmrB/QacA subfamily drug resistance transporter
MPRHPFPLSAMPLTSSRFGPLIVPLIVACALLMENVDSTILVTAIPVLARDLGHSPITLKLAVISYVVGLGVFIPICGWVADRFGARTVFRAAIVVFVAGSLLCAAATSLTTLVLARFIQGVGGAMMVPVGRILMFRAVPKSEFIRAVTYLSIPAQAGPVLGPLLGGFITTYLNWRLMFFINVPIGILGIYLTNRYIENSREEHPGKLDWTGFVLSGLGASLFMMGMSTIGSGLILESTAVGFVLIGILLLGLYWIYSQRVENPLLDLSFLRIPTFNCSVLGGSLFRIGLGALPFLLPLLLQDGLGMTAFQGGIITCCSAIGSFCTKTVAIKILKRWGFRRVLIVNAVLCGMAVAVCGILHPGMSWLTIWFIVTLGGVFPALQFTSLNSLAYADIETRDVGRSTSVASVIQQMSLGLGVTIAGMLLHLSQSLRGQPQLAWTDFWPAFLIVGLCSVASILITRRMPADGGSSVAGASPAPAGGH